MASLLTTEIVEELRRRLPGAPQMLSVIARLREGIPELDPDFDVVGGAAPAAGTGLKMANPEDPRGHSFAWRSGEGACVYCRGSLTVFTRYGESCPGPPREQGTKAAHPVAFQLFHLGGHFFTMGDDGSRCDNCGETAADCWADRRDCASRTNPTPEHSVAQDVPGTLKDSAAIIRDVLEVHSSEVSAADPDGFGSPLEKCIAEIRRRIEELELAVEEIQGPI